MLTPEVSRDIAEAVARAEKTTRGEICCVVTEEASTYPEVPLICGFAAALLVLPLASLFGFDPMALGWRLSDWRIAHVAATETAARSALAGLLLLQALSFAIVAGAALYPPLRRVLTPRWIKRARLYRRARELFAAKGLDRTRERTGVLLLASLRDRYAVVLGDRGINDKVGPEAWREVIAALVAGMRAREAGHGFVAAIDKCGALLATHFPANGDNPNEIPDAPQQA